MRLLKYALKNIFRTPILSISSITVITLMTFLIFVLFFAEFVTKVLAEIVNTRLTLNLVVKNGYTGTSKEIIDLLNEVRSLSPWVGAKFTSADEHLEIMREKDPELARVVETDTENPLPSTVSIDGVPTSVYEQLDTVIAQRGEAIVKEETGRNAIVGYKNQFERIRTVVQVLNSLRYGLLGIIGFFLLSVFVVIFHSIGNAVFYFREEIKITELVGGQRRYVYWPFVIQGMLYAITALIISGSVFYVGMGSINLNDVLSAPVWFNMFLDRSGGQLLLLGGIVVLLGALSGFISSYRFARS